MKQQRPGTARSVTDGLKLHRHPMRAHGPVRTVITLRPGTRVQFSTNRFHETWHVLSDDHGARLLARLLWGLSYQARPGTVVLIDRPFLRPTPFDADPADPIVLVPGWCTTFDEHAARNLKNLLPLTNPEGTVRWRSFGLDRTLEPATLDVWWDTRWHRHRHRRDIGTVARRAGLLVLTPGAPDECRAWALQTAGLDTTNAYGTDHTYLGPWNRGYDGEIQIFRRFGPMVNIATQARAQVLSAAEAPTGPDELRAAVWDEAETIRGEEHLRVRVFRDRTWTLGYAAAEMLDRADVHSLEDLAAIGAVEAYRRMRAAGVRGLDPRMLWAMEGALIHRDRRGIPLERRRELLAELGDEPPGLPSRRRSRSGRVPHRHRVGAPKMFRTN
ncbi:TfoX/Sxy family DNA transformation protein [Nocardia vaccinii]|uniref:TfoX/Sxy family DNA transformation protein n=1 Tax=Nocardia vaccinii TaxID=1822 RepID=UPI0008348145|nr:TfoX/Sxy family DNA transformation protein [Nocardia vaccinii]